MVGALWQPLRHIGEKVLLRASVLARVARNTGPALSHLTKCLFHCCKPFLNVYEKKCHHHLHIRFHLTNYLT